MKLKNVALVVAVLLPLVLVCRPAEARVNISIDLPIFSFPYPPQLVVIPGTYAYYAADVDLDIIFYQGRWYRPWGDHWYWARGYDGPWVLAGPRFVPAVLWRLPRDYRHGPVYGRIPYYDLHRHWRNWERERHWERHHDWWRKARDEHRFDRDRRDGRDDRYRQDDRRDGRDNRYRQDNRRDRRDDRTQQSDRRDLKRDRRGADRDQDREGRDKRNQNSGRGPDDRR